MKNLRDIPKKIYIEDIFNTVLNYDYTSSLNIYDKNYIDITLPLSDINNVSNKSISNRFIPEQNEKTYNSFYQYYNYNDTNITSKNNITNDYPDNSQYPDSHNNQIGSDGTIVINTNSYSTDNLNLAIVQEYNTVPKEQWDESPQDYISTLYNIVNSETSNGYRIINNLSFNDHSILANNSYQINKYSYTYKYNNLYNPSSIFNLNVGYYDMNIFTNGVQNHINKQEDEGIYIYYKLIDTKPIIQNNNLLEQEILYIFNEQHQINTIQGYLYNFKQSGLSGKILSSDREYYGSISYLDCDTSYFINEYTEDNEHFDEVLLTVYSFNSTIDEQIPIGSRNLFSPDVIDLEKLLPIEATYTSKIKLVITQKFLFDNLSLDNTSNLNGDTFNNISCGLEPEKYSNSNITNTLQFKRCLGCSKFLPGFNVELLKSNQSSYHTSYDTKTFKRFKPFETTILNTEFIKERIYMKDSNYYPYIYNLSYSNNNLEFKVNKNSYKHNEILYNGYSDVDVSLITYNYNDTTNYSDVTILESYNFTNLDNLIISDFTSNINNINNYFINIKLNQNQNIDNIINFISKINYYTNVYNNYEYNFILPQINNISSIKKILTYEYESDSTTIKEIQKINSNYILLNKNITNIILDNTANIDKTYIQITEISDSTILQEKQFDGTNYINNFNENNYYSLNDGTNIISISDYTCNNNTDYILLLFSNNNNIQNNTFDYNNISKFNFTVNYPIKLTLTNVNSITDVNNIINNNNIFSYKIQWIKKV